MEGPPAPAAVAASAEVVAPGTRQTWRQGTRIQWDSYQVSQRDDHSRHLVAAPVKVTVQAAFAASFRTSAGAVAESHQTHAVADRPAADIPVAWCTRVDAGADVQAGTHGTAATVDSKAFLVEEGTFAAAHRPRQGLEIPNS